MEHLSPLLLYFLITSGATVNGLFYWMAVENLGKIKLKFVFTLFLSLLLTPFGAWVISLIFKTRHLKKELKQLNESAA